MKTQDLQRKLAAILSADVEGYSRLMGRDELSTVGTITEYREVISVLIRKHQGRVVDSPGDNLLAEFASVVHAVQCAVDIQETLQAKNARRTEDRQMRYRIGVHLGDVIVEGERIYGDGVNIASRIEGLAEAGGICVSGAVYDSVGNRLNLEYTPLGEQSVKNIAKPVRVYRVAVTPASSADRRTKRARRWTTPARVAAGAFLLALAGALFWRYVPRSVPTTPAVSSGDRHAPVPTGTIPVAVLPFVNVTGDKEQEYFSNGITLEIITDLSRVSGLTVMADHPLLTRDGPASHIADVGKALGAQYVLRGTVERTKDKLRITAQLVDTATGGYYWSHRYEGNPDNLFDLQNEVSQNIVSALSVHLSRDEKKRMMHEYTQNEKAYDLYLQGLEHENEMTAEFNLFARQMFQRAIELDPAFASAHTHLGLTYFRLWSLGWTSDPAALDHAEELARKTIALDPSLDEGYVLLGEVCLWKMQRDDALVQLEKALALEPANPNTLSRLGNALNYVGRPLEAVELVRKAMDLNPAYPVWYTGNLAHSYYLLGRYEEAAAELRRAVRRKPGYLPAYILLAACYVAMGRQEEAQAAAASANALGLQVTLEGWRLRTPLFDPAATDLFLERIGKAGIK